MIYIDVSVSVAHNMNEKTISQIAIDADHMHRDKQDECALYTHHIIQARIMNDMFTYKSMLHWAYISAAV